MTDLHALRDMVRRAEGPDRKIDGAIALWVVDTLPEDERARRLKAAVADRKAGAPAPAGGVPHYTASIDAALALVSAKMPGMERSMLRWAITRMGVAGEDWSQDRLARSILIEFFTALAETETKETGHGK